MEGIKIEIEEIDGGFTAEVVFRALGMRPYKIYLSSLDGLDVLSLMAEGKLAIEAETKALREKYARDLAANQSRLVENEPCELADPRGIPVDGQAD